MGRATGQQVAEMRRVGPAFRGGTNFIPSSFRETLPRLPSPCLGSELLKNQARDLFAAEALTTPGSGSGLGWPLAVSGTGEPPFLECL